MEPAEYAYRPDYAIPPGETLRDALEALEMTQTDLARRTGLSTKHINQIVQGVASISPDTALALERVVGVPARMWNALEANYRAQQLRLRDRTIADEDVTWVRRFPIRELVAREIIRATKDVVDLREQLFAFFGVASREAWEAVWLTPAAAFRRSSVFEADQMATAAWLRIGEREAAKLEVAPFDRQRLLEALSQIRTLMVKEPAEFEPAMRQLLADGGVALVVVEEIKGSRANGAARWLTPTKALIQLSLRYRWEDVFCFSLFHEAAHLLLHGKRDVFVDESETGEPSGPDAGDDLETYVDGAGATGPDEDQANAFAADFLIPSTFERELLRIRDLVPGLAFAHKLGVPPGVVIGRLQRERLLPYNVGNQHRRRFRLVNDGENEATEGSDLPG